MLQLHKMHAVRGVLIVPLRNAMRMRVTAVQSVPRR
jgi:hypothetical protein